MTVPPIKIKNLNFAYAGSASALENVSLEISEGAFVGVIGPNGGGKSTLLKLILGILQPSSGSVQVFGQSPDQSRGKIGYVPQYSTFMQQFPISVLDTVSLGLLGITSSFGLITRNDRKTALGFLDRLGIADLANRPISALSGGQLQRVLIARALVSSPKLLLLDEPTASIDPTGEEDVFRILRQFSDRLTIVVVSHDVGFVSAYVNKIVCVSRSIACHAPSEVSAQTLSHLYGAHGHAIAHHHHDEHGHNHK